MDRRSIRTLLGLSLLLAGALAGPAAGQQPTITLDEAIRRSLEASPQMVQASGAVTTARAAERSALGAYFPTLSLSTGSSLAGNQQRAQGGITSQTNDSYSAGLSTGVDLYTGGRRAAQGRQAKAQSTVAEATVTEQQYAVALSAKRAFFEVLKAADLRRVAETSVQRATEGLAAAENRQRVGSATRSDVLRSQYELASARQKVLEAENQHRTATYALGRLVGLDGPVGAAPTAVGVAPLGLSDAELVELAVSASPSVRAADAELRAGDAGLDAARTAYLPTVRLTSGYNWANQQVALTTGLTSWNVGLNVSLPILNGFQREETVQRARVQTLVADAQLRDARLAARESAERLLGNLRLAEQKIALAEESVRLSEEDLRVQQDRYRLGASTILDQVQSQENLAQAETALVTARFDYQIARAELEALTGSEL